jgi:SAM-dependent methyltransferase
MIDIDPSTIAAKYNKIDEIWTKDDRWHWLTYMDIKKFISEKISIIPDKEYRILNAGSGGNNYDLPDSMVTHVDIAEEKLKIVTKKIISSIENIPVSDNYFDIVICVGSVINYCDPIKSIAELHRVLKSDGLLILEYESSNTFELIGKSAYNKSVVLINTFYNNTTEKIWYYSCSFIEDILSNIGFQILSKRPFHILSPLVYRICHNSSFSSFFHFFDKPLRHLPFVNRLCSNKILVAQKASTTPKEFAK